MRVVSTRIRPSSGVLPIAFSTTAALSTMPPSKLRRSWLTNPRKSSRLASASSDLHPLAVEEQVGLFAFERQQLRKHARGLRAFQLQGGVRRRPLVLNQGVFENAFPRHGDTGRERRVAFLHPEVRFLARFEQHRIRVLAGAAEDLVGALDHRISASRQCQIALVALFPQAFVRLFALGRWVGLFHWHD